MNILRLIAVLGLPLSLTLPVNALAAPTAMTVAQVSEANPQQLKTAVANALKEANLTPHQKMQIRPMIQNYQSETANADAAQKKTAQEKLLKGIYGVLTPAQQTTVKNSLKSQLGSAP
jgi:Spy/CpxP family protein refolding chaperone